MRNLLAALLVMAAPIRAATPHEPPPPFTAAPLAMGSSWYPEQWPEARWEADLALMERAHLNVVRVGEFAWSRLEPSEGVYDFAWLDRAIAAAGRHGLRVVIGTPTAAPPIWLTRAHPETLRIDADGRTATHGGRRHFSYASATYRRYATRIAEALARRYGRNPDVVGWQIDNEIGVPSYDLDAKAGWATWLAARYQTIGALNQRWATAYWSQTYTSFDQVPLTLAADQNPALILDARRYASSTWADYVSDQANAIRRHADPRQFVTTNSTLWNNNFDQYRVHRALDIAAWDEYVPDGHPDWPALALHHAVVHGYKRRNFWIMETQPGRVDWGPVNRSLDPGQTRELAWQAVAHGADAILYWQWRSALNGQEQYHGTLVGPDGTPMPIYDEIARTAGEMRVAARHLARTIPAPAEVALIYSQDSRWSVEHERHSLDYDPIAVMKDWYRPFAAAGIRVDVVPPDADLSTYRLVLAPQLTVMDAALAQRLENYVVAGGHLLLGSRSGLKDSDNALAVARQPGPLGRLLGARVDYYYPIDATVKLDSSTVSGVARIWAETLEVMPGTTVLARYSPHNNWLSNKPAFAMRAGGKGWIAYLGALLDAEGQAGIVRWARTSASLTDPLIASQPGLEIVERKLGRDRYLIAINHGDEARSPSIPARFKVIVGDMYGKILPPHGIVLLGCRVCSP